VRTFWFMVVVLAAVLAGCGFGRQAVADTPQFTLGREFTLDGGQEAVLGEGAVRLRFTDVIEDSRCPTKVECFWTGQARISLSVQPAGSPPSTVVFNTNPAPGQNVQTAQVDGYSISLKSLDPYPQTPGDPISFEDYRATLLVAAVKASANISKSSAVVSTCGDTRSTGAVSSNGARCTSP
jgi:hypothetical protein